MEPFVSNTFLEFLGCCEEATDQGQVLDATEKVIRHFGVEYFAMAFLPLAHERLDSYFVWERWPPGWLDRYLNQNYIHADPIVSFVKSTGRPSVWSQSQPLPRLVGKPKRIMSEAYDFGMHDGLTVPLRSRSGLGGLFSVAGSRGPFGPPEVSLLQLVADTALRRVLDLGAAAQETFPNDLRITRSESECLTLCAAGKTDRQIGDITYRSPRTVQAHIRNLQLKLGVSNRAQLIAEAFRRGLQR